MKKGTLFLLFMGITFSLILITWNIVRGDSEYAGSEACKDCYEAYYKGFAKSIHGKKAVPGNPGNREGCESCHGPGAQHVEKGGGKGVAIFVFGRGGDLQTRATKCLACHEIGRAHV